MYSVGNLKGVVISRCNLYCRNVWTKIGSDIAGDTGCRIQVSGNKDDDMNSWQSSS